MDDESRTDWVMACNMSSRAEPCEDRAKTAGRMRGLASMTMGPIGS